MSDSLFPVSEQDIRKLATASSFERGMGSFVRGAIKNPVREGHVLRAECEGSMVVDYRLRAEFAEKDIIETWCSCPYSYGGICKHLVALLLTWVREPERFAAYDDLATVLATWPKETLVAAIVEMVQRDTAPHEVIDRYREQPANVPSPPVSRSHRVSAAAYSSEIASIIGEGADWYHMDELLDGLYTVQRTANGFAQRGEFTNAAIIYTELLRGCIEGIQYCDDSSGGMGFLGQQCAEALQETVPQTDWDEDERQLWLWDMFELCVNDMGGYGFEDDLREMILATYQPADVEILESWIHEALDNASGTRREDWRQRGLITMVLKLHEREGREEDYLKLCADQGHRLALCEKLVDLGRIEEVTQLVRQQPLSSHEAWSLIERLERSGHEQLALEVAEAALPEANGWPVDKIGDWLLKRYNRQGDLEGALNVHLARFRSNRTFMQYQMVADVAQQLDRWQQLKPELDVLVQERGSRSLQVEVALADGNLPQAIKMVERFKGAVGAALAGRVAAQAGASAEHYRWAIACNERLAEKRIAGKNRRLYQEARGYLGRIREIYLCHNAHSEWESFVTDLRRRHRGKRVFLEIIEGL
jgi:uncharacterized Zn finger protein